MTAAEQLLAMAEEHDRTVIAAKASVEGARRNAEAVADWPQLHAQRIAFLQRRVDAVGFYEARAQALRVGAAALAGEGS